jgi:hypothetical protein
MDTGPAVQGRHVDLYMWSCYEALDFGRRPIHLTVVRLGWNPKATGPKLVDRLLNFRRTPRPEGPPQPEPLPLPPVKGPAPAATEPVPQGAPAQPASLAAPVQPIPPAAPVQTAPATVIPL